MADINLTTVAELDGETIDVTVHEDSTGDDASDTSVTQSIGDGVNTYTLSGFDLSTGSQFWLDVSISSTSPTSSPKLKTATLDFKDLVAPSADFVANPRLEAAVGETLLFDGSSSSDPDGTVDTYEWDFTNDGTVDATGQTVEHAYSSTGVKTCSLTVTDNDGATNETTKDVLVVEANVGDQFVKIKGSDGIAQSELLNKVRVREAAIDQSSDELYIRIDKTGTFADDFRKTTLNAV